MAKKNENIAEETVKKTTKKAKTEGEAVEKTEEEIAAEIAAKFDEKCKGLLQIAKKKKNVLDYQEIMNYFLDTDFEADKMEKVFEFLENNNVDVKMADDDTDDDEIILEADKSKFIGRQTYLSDGIRKENDAEHSWHLALMTALLSEDRKSTRLNSSHSH